ncbi:MAG TPA: right-handed parallel beta-helix repeat-containing protein [Phycisphaerae bacterium]|nr:right-handed parallel beta-helix repeat-containing protein [Phycisphaerae bacterium]
MKRFPMAAVCVLTIATGLWIAHAGDLNPPVGPVAPTMKTLAEVEPRIAINATNTPGDADSLFNISQRGSYYLTGNITGVAGKHGIEIAAGGVTLDLNGFDLVGVAGMGPFDGVSVTVVGLTNVAVVNGSVRNWGHTGIDIFLASNSRVADVLASGNAGNGISAGSVCTVTNCSAYLNTGHGFITGNGCTVSNCSAYTNTGNGISTNGGCTVSNCSVFLNTASGITTSSGCTVADCIARANTLDGIVCGSACVIRGNTCSSNGSGGDGAGIHAFGTDGDNRIEGNNCTDADRGIDVDFAGNLIIKNTCSGNTTNWDVAIGNAVAPIVAATTNGAAIGGNTYAGSLGSTDPNANFTY